MIATDLLYFDHEHQLLCVDLIPERHALVELHELQQLHLSSQYREFAFLDHDVRKALQLLKHQAKGANKGQSQRIPIAQQIDGSCQLSLSTDKMQVTATLTCPQGGSKIGFAELVQELQRLAIKNGLLSNNINALLAKAEHGTPGESISATIAKGKPPVHGKDAKLERLVKLSRERLLKPKVLDNGKVNMRDLGEIITVSNGDEVMRKHEPRPGIDGYNVIGEVLKAKPGKDRKLKAGKGTIAAQQDHNLLLATTDGQPKETKDGLEIVEVLTLKNVDVGTGHIQYHGAIVIQGNIEEDMEVTAGGDITVNGFVDNATLKAGGDIIVAKGVIGRQRPDESLTTTLEAQGQIHVSFAQYATLKSAGDIHVQTQLIHCHTHCGDNLTVGVANGKKGDLVGGRAVVIHSLSSINLGSRAATQSSVRAGAGITRLRHAAKEYQQREQALLAQSYKLRQAINKATMANDKSDEERKKLVEQFTLAQQQNSAKLSEAQLLLAETEERIESFFSRVSISASHSLFPQVEMEIGLQSLTTDREYGPSKVSNDGNHLKIDAITS
ncbi:DUF342 domain-containing protein [Ferrimonas sp. SCSIO 43195]|uniref:DUF342 domain-containing protein n=1 Tax=Ferrimonas sp. SCSIO 43195 TaxID=2822844 RepID=UPI002074D0CD|nr:FapA family protein [Ferrimonas sp. SCSIO 43195]USD38040.1 DUF342 domain-containing protein [Ferrimonas sp. SCSIO 43195]